MEILIINSEINEMPIQYFFKITQEEKEEFNKIMDENPAIEEIHAFKQA